MLNNLIIDFDQFNHFYPLSSNDGIEILTSSEISSSKIYLFKNFKIKHYTSQIQKTILETFYEISTAKNRFLQTYKRFSFSFLHESKLTFSMRFISDKTVETVLQSSNLLSEWKVENILLCLFSVSEAMKYLHDNLIIHGNLCPSNIVIDEVGQFYVCDFGLYPIKSIFLNEQNMFNKIYKDPLMINNEPTFQTDVYSFGILMCHFFLSYSQLLEDKSTVSQENLIEFISNDDQNKYKKIPQFIINLIQSCLDSKATNRPSFKQIIDSFKNMETFKIKDEKIDIPKLYNELLNTDYLLKLSSKNGKYAFKKMGDVYLKGKGVEIDKQKAMDFYQKAADLNNSKAQSYYGASLQEVGINNEPDIEKGAEYLIKSVNQGNFQGMLNYGLALLKGCGVEKNLQKAEEYLKKSADYGYPEAQVSYGFAIIDNNPTPERINEGLKYIRKAMNQKYPDAFCTYAYMLKEGKYIEKNDELAMKNFKIAADLNNDDAMIEYADGNLKGIGVPKNNDVAIKYYQLASIKGNELAKKRIEELVQSNFQIMDPLSDQNQPPTLNQQTTLNEQHFSQPTTFNQQTTLNEQHFSQPTTLNQQTTLNEQHYSQQTILNQQTTLNEQHFSQPTTSKDLNCLTPKTMNNSAIISNKAQLSVKLPLQISQKLNLISLGKVVYDRPAFHTENYIYPVGYQVERKYFSIEDPQRETLYRETVLDGGSTPIFRVECLDNSKMVFEGNCPSRPWNDAVSEIYKSIEKLGISKVGRKKIPGPHFFGFALRQIAYLIDRLPNANKCTNHVFQKLFVRGVDPEIEGGKEVVFANYNDVNKNNSPKKITNKEEEPNREEELSKNEELNKEEGSKREEELNKEEETDEEETNQKDELNSKSKIESESDSESDEETSNKIVFDFNKPVEELIQIGNELNNQNDATSAFQYFEEAAKRGYSEAYLKCAEVSPTLEKEIEYYELSISSQVPGSFDKFRSEIMKKVSFPNYKTKLSYFAQVLINNKDFSDAAYIYIKKLKDKNNFKICYEKAKENIEKVENGDQQYTFGLLAQGQNDLQLAKLLFKKAYENNVLKAKAKIDELEHQSK